MNDLNLSVVKVKMSLNNQLPFRLFLCPLNTGYSMRLSS